MWVQSLGWEDPLQKKMATHSSILAWERKGKGKEPGELQSMGLQRVGHELVTKQQQNGDTVIPRCGGGVGSRTPPNTKIHKCSSPLYKMT